MLLLFIACRAPEPEPEVLPPVVDAVTLAATLSPDSVVVEGTIGGPQHVDLDAPTDARDGFRYQILADDGSVLYERTTQGPAIVSAFLGYWGETADIDLLEALPTFGRFQVQVPLIDGGNTVRFQMRDGSGYTDLGDYDLTQREADDLGIRPVEGVATLHESGPSDNRLDLVILGDGYPVDALPRFHRKADRVVEALLATAPFSTYADKINIHRVDTASAEAGASFDCPTCGTRDTVFGSMFPVELINRFTGSNYDARALIQIEQWEVARAASNVPWDMALVLVNTDQFGGMAVHYATASANDPGFAETSVHELGHLIGFLGDEYVADACIRDDRVGLAKNISADPLDPPWAHWIEPDTPLPTPSSMSGTVGAFQNAYNCNDLYRPRRNCLMRSGENFCPVCTEQLVRRLHRYTDPVDGIQTDGDEAWVDGDHPLIATWSRGGEVFATSSSGERVDVGKAPYTVEVLLDAPEVRAERQDLTQRYRR